MLQGLPQREKDIFLQGLRAYSESTLFPILEYKDKKIKPDGIPSFVKNIIGNTKYKISRFIAFT